MQAAIAAVYLQLWVLSFVNEDNGPLYNADEGDEVYTKINDLEGFVVLCLFFLIGSFSDKIKPTIFLPFSFAMRGIILIGLSLLSNPKSPISYILWMLYAMFNIMESIGIDGFYAKNVKNEIAGAMWGIMGISALLGQVISLKLGAKLYSINAGYVLLFIGVCDIVIVGFLVLMTYLGKLKPIGPKELNTA